MGVEKVIPSMSDLVVFLAILARSATGQRLSVYTTLVQGPRKPGELDGPEALAYGFTEYFENEVLRKRPYLTKELCIRVVQQAIRDEPQEGNRFWAAVPELGNDIYAW